MQRTQTTRYERVQDILDAAAEKSTADYEGLGNFWRLPLDELLEVRVGGVRMVERGNSGSSGLIAGLRGIAPFDGSRFPALPWGGTRVAADDIDFIAAWIDDGCSPNERELAEIPAPLTRKPRLLQVLELDNVEPAIRDVTAAPNAYKYQQGETKQRMNLDCMLPSQIDELRAAFREMYALNKWPEDRRSYNNMALVHQNHCQHGWERFLPWHRIYLYEFEQALQDHAPGVTMPYWDWTMPQYCPEQPTKGRIIPDSFKAFLTSDSLSYLTRADPVLPAAAAATLQEKMVDAKKVYTSPHAFFEDVKAFIGDVYAADKHRHRFVDALLAANSLWYPLRYPAEYGGPTINEAIHYHYPTANDIAEIMSLRTFRDFGGGSLYNDSFGFIDQNPHNTMHIWTGGFNPDFVAPTTDLKKKTKGGDRNRTARVAGRRIHSREDMASDPPVGDMLSNLTASYDPIFWPIHANVDRLWSEWQELHPHSNPADLDAVLTPWSYTIADTLDISKFGYEYVKSTHLVPVGMGTPVGRFVSAPLAIPEPVRGGFRQAEVRLHRVPQLPRSCFIRVFLNLPDADASTPIDNSHYAGYLAIFGHGACYGGPGHCDIPERRPRPYDLRPRDHNTPRNHRVNVTKAATQLLAGGATTLQVTLVVIGADYCEDSDLLRLDGVSLTFLD
jgi:tyrosinase